MATRLIGSGTTDSQGKVNINYTGTGAGKLQLIAKNGNLTSATYELIDATFYDPATTNNKNTNWLNYNNRMTIETDTQGTTITNSNASNGYCFANGSDPFVFTDYCCEFDVLAINDAVKWYHQNNSSGTQDMFRIDSYYTSGTVHFKLECQGGSLKVYTNGTLQTTVTNTVTGAMEVAFRLDAQTSDPRSIKYKNFVIYPI